MGDGVVERTIRYRVRRAPSQVRTYRSREALLFGQSRCLKREADILPTRAWQIPTGAHLKILTNKNTHVYKNLQYPPPMTELPNDLTT